MLRTMCVLPWMHFHTVTRMIYTCVDANVTKLDHMMQINNVLACKLNVEP